MQVALSLDIGRETLWKLVSAARSALQGAAVSGMPGSLAAQLEAAAGSLSQQMEAADASGRVSAPQLPPLLQLAAHLAGLLQQHLALPALEAYRLLAEAQATAGRSCAYLRCANVAGEGGPAAGQGTGSMRCRWAWE